MITPNGGYIPQTTGIPALDKRMGFMNEIFGKPKKYSPEQIVILRAAQEVLFAITDSFDELEKANAVTPGLAQAIIGASRAIAEVKQESAIDDIIREWQDADLDEIDMARTLTIGVEVRILHDWDALEEYGKLPAGIKAKWEKHLAYLNALGPEEVPDFPERDMQVFLYA